MEFFDCNAMLGPWKHNYGDSFPDAESLLIKMDGCSIKKSLVYDSLAKYNDQWGGNLRLVEQTKGHPRLYSAAVAMPHHTGEFPAPDEFAAFIKKHRIAAVRIFPVFHNIKLYDYIWGDLFKRLEAMKIPLMIDFDVTHWSNEVDYEAVRRIVITYPKLPVILMRMSVLADRYIYPIMEKHDNLYIDLSMYFGTGGLALIAGRFGARRLLFGTNMPFQNPYPSIVLVATNDLTDEQKCAAAGGNLETLIGEVDYDA